MDLDFKAVSIARINMLWASLNWSHISVKRTENSVGDPGMLCLATGTATGAATGTAEGTAEGTATGAFVAKGTATALSNTLKTAALHS